jgi:hypothetical protein
VLYHGTGTKLYGTAATPWGTVVPVQDVGELKTEIKVEGLDEFTAAVKAAAVSVEEFGKSLTAMAQIGAISNDAVKGLGDVLKKFDAAFGFTGADVEGAVVITEETAASPLALRAAQREAEKLGIPLMCRAPDGTLHEFTEPEPAPSSQPPTRKRRIRLPEEP